MVRGWAALVWVMAGCNAAPRSPLIVEGMLAPPTSDNDACLYQAVASGPFLSQGTMDVSLTTQYFGVMLLGSTAPLTPCADRVACFDDSLIVTGATVTDALPDGTVLDTFTMTTAAFLEAPASGAPGLGTASFQLVSGAAACAALKSGRVLATVRAFGDHGGEHVVSDAVTIPIDICEGCLATCGATTPCIVGQDQPIACGTTGIVGLACAP